MILLSGFLLSGMIDMARSMFLQPFLAPNGKNACRNPNNCPKAARKLKTKFLSLEVHKKMIHLHAVFCYHEG
jgi:hypothetical protein